MKCAICQEGAADEPVAQLRYVLIDLRKRTPDVGIATPAAGDYAHASCALDLRARIARKEKRR